MTWVEDLNAIKAGIMLVVTLVGSGGAVGLWKLFTGDFLNPYREDQRDLRARLEAAETKADTATDTAAKALAATHACEEREARMRLVLIRHGIDLEEA